MVLLILISNGAIISLNIIQFGGFNMSNTIEKLYEGKLEPFRLTGKSNSEMRRTETLIERNKKKLEEALDDDRKKIFEKYVECMNEYLILTSEQVFCDGFCMGARILSEAISGAEQLL